MNAKLSARLAWAAAALLICTGVVACKGGTTTTGGGVDPTGNPSITALSVNPSTVVGGESSQGTVTVSPAPTSAASVALSSSSGSATVQPSVAVSAGATSATFNISTSVVQASTPATITGTLNGTRTATLTIGPVPPPAVAARIVVRSLTAAKRKGNGSQLEDVPNKGAGSLDTCPLVNVNGSPQLSCEFDGGSSTSPTPITNYAWRWNIAGKSQDSQSNFEPKFQPKVSDCGFFSGVSGATSSLQLIVNLTITTSTDGVKTAQNQNVAVYPAGLCGYPF
jgi:hypothetical protein